MGKSFFINIATGGDWVSESSLEPCQKPRPSSCPFCLRVFSVATSEIHKHDPFVHRNCGMNIEQQVVENDRPLRETDAGHSILEDLR